MVVVLAAVAALIPLLITPSHLFYFDVTPKVVVLLLGTAVALVWFAWRGDGLHPLLASRTGRWLCALLAAQAVSLALSTAWSAAPELSLSGTNWRRFGLITQAALLAFTLLAAARVAVHPRDLLLLLRVISVSGVPAALYGVLQYLGWDPWLPAEAYHVGDGIWTIVRPPGTLGHASYFASYCLYVVFAGAALAAAGRAFWKALGLAAVAAGSAAVILSGTRSALLGLLAGAAVMVVCFPPRLRRRTLASGAILLVAAAVFYSSPAGWKLRSRTRWYTEDPLGGARLLLWPDSMRLGAAHWAVGSGPETFSSAFTPFQSVALSQAYPDFYHESPHNMFLDAFAAQGLPGLAVLLLLGGLGAYGAWTARSREPLLAPALGASLAAAVVSQQFVSFTVPTALFFYLTVGLAAASPGAERDVPRRRLLSLSVALPLAAVMVAFAACLFWADRALAQVKRDLEQGEISRAINGYQTVRRWQPRGVSADLWFSRKLGAAAGKSPDLLVRLLASREALEAAVRATQTAEDRHNAYYNLAALYAAHNDLAHTEQSLRSAIRWAPNWFKPHWVLAQVLETAGRRREAAAEAAIAVQLNGGKNPEVAVFPAR
ncbi:MAG: O-antigen ligase family protein [Acidobacteriota bacterium]